MIASYRQTIRNTSKNQEDLVVVTDNADDFSDNFGMFIHRDRLVFGVFRGQMDDSGLPDQPFDSGIFLSNASDNNIAIFRGVLRPDDDQIPVKNAGSGHGIALNAQS